MLSVWSFNHLANQIDIPVMLTPHSGHIDPLGFG